MLDVMVFTAHRRGEYFMDRLAQMDVRVQAFDFTDHLGARPEQDVLGPFGFFEGERWTRNEINWLEKNFIFAKQKQGFSFWSDQGLMEATGLVSEHQKKRLQNWGTTVASSFFSSVDLPISALAEAPAASDYFSTFYLPWELHNPKAKLMTVDSAVRFENQPGAKKLFHRDQEYNAQYLVHFLSGAEIMNLHRLGLNPLLTGEALTPRFCWQRVDIRLEADVDLSVLPLQVLMVPYLQSPWQEEDFFVLKEQENEHHYSLWYRTWYERHKEMEHFKNVADKIEAQLKKLIPGAKLQYLTVPFEVENEHAVSLFPVFDQTEWTLQNKWVDKGIYNGSVDKCANYLWSTQLDLQQNFIKHLAEELKND